MLARAGIVCTAESYKEMVTLTFARGASLEDPAKRAAARNKDAQHHS
jgi:hypothetical protein